MVFIFLTLFVNILFILFMPKRLTRQEIYVTWGLLAAIAFYIDVFLGYVMDLYDFGKEGIQFYDQLVDAVVPPSFGIIFLNYMPSNRSKLMIYVLSWVFFQEEKRWNQS